MNSNKNNANSREINIYEKWLSLRKLETKDVTMYSKLKYFRM